MLGNAIFNIISMHVFSCFFFQAEDGIRDRNVTGVQTCALPISISGVSGISTPAPQLDLILYSEHNNELLRTLVVTRGGGRLCSPGSIRAYIGDSSHPMAQRLRKLGIHGQKPKLVFYSDTLQLRLNAGAKLIR